MSEEKVLCSHELVIRFEQLEGNRITWYIEPDKKVCDTQGLSLVDLAECGAPLAAIGIRALWKLCADGLIYSSLEQANSIQSDVIKRLDSDPVEKLMDAIPEGATIN